MACLGPHSEGLVEGGGEGGREGGAAVTGVEDGMLKVLQVQFLLVNLKHNRN